MNRLQLLQTTTPRTQKETTCRRASDNLVLSLYSNHVMARAGTHADLFRCSMQDNTSQAGPGAMHSPTRRFGTGTTAFPFPPCVAAQARLCLVHPAVTKPQTPVWDRAYTHTHTHIGSCMHVCTRVDAEMCTCACMHTGVHVRTDTHAVVNR